MEPLKISVYVPPYYYTTLHGQFHARVLVRRNKGN